MNKSTICIIALSLLTSAAAAQSPSGCKAVDMGLSVKWASCNVGASSESECGDFFAWGETSPKPEYSMSNYRFWISGDKPESVRMKKYVPLKGRENCDGKASLEAADDAACVNWGENWRTPTKKEWLELLDKCDWKWDDTDGRKGCIVTSRRNGNSLFLPAAGYRFDSTSQDEGRFGYYMSSTMNSMNMDLGAIGMFFNWDHKIYYISRSAGVTVRPVTD